MKYVCTTNHDEVCYYSVITAISLKCICTEVAVEASCNIFLLSRFRQETPSNRLSLRPKVVYT